LQATRNDSLDRDVVQEKKKWGQGAEDYLLHKQWMCKHAMSEEYGDAIPSPDVSYALLSDIKIPLTPFTFYKT
jgi:hypothetical protein